MEFIPLNLAAARLGLSTSYLRTLCRKRLVPGAVFDGRRWLLPDGAQVIRKASGLYKTTADPVPNDMRKMAELDARMRRLAAAISTGDGVRAETANEEDHDDPKSKSRTRRPAGS